MSDVGEVSEIESFRNLCDDLVEDGMNFLYSRIYRTHSTGWVAEIRSSQDQKIFEILAIGQDEDMNKAIRDCVEDFNERQAIKKRRAELLAIPEVREAMTLFGFSDSKANQVSK